MTSSCVLVFFYATVLLCSLLASGLTAADSKLDLGREELTDEEIQQIIRKFAEKETEFARARENYTYRQTVRLSELDESGRVIGRFEQVTDIIFGPGGERVERVLYAPVPTLKRILLTPEDEQDLRNVQPFVLTVDMIDEYYVRYLGKDMVDEIPCYVFAVKPKELKPGKRYFAGLIYVDDRDLQIVKTYGRGVGLQRKGVDNQFPKFETYRLQIDGKYWFPVYTRAEDTLWFEAGPQKIRMIVRYENYKQFKSETVIKYGEPVGEPKDQEENKP